ncbi:MAG: triose-phosphate isomerase [Gammaproteobacteria bacterium]|nr:triose-phosphate isomerase [Gammaproteobacteria bacterium]
MKRTYLVAGNWKMNGSRVANAALVQGIRAGAGACKDVELLVCPPAVYLESAAQLVAGSGIGLGAQTLCEQEKAGAFTGEVHGAMLKEVGCRYAIVGHSERRALYGESDALVARKFRTAQACGLVPILCVGETLQQREANETERVLQRQLDAVVDLCGIAAFGDAVIAYEPVWAIGTGRTATPQQAQEAHAFLRAQLAKRDGRIAASLRLLYGGSVKADNARTLFEGPDVDGGLIGGASLKADEFLAIAAAAQAQSI